MEIVFSLYLLFLIELKGDTSLYTGPDPSQQIGISDNG